MNLQELKSKSPTELLSFAEELQIENASTLRKQDMMFAILKQLAEKEVEITGEGVLEVLQDGFGFLRSAEANYLPGPDDIYVSPNQIRRFGLRTGDTIEGTIRAPKDGERYFALLKVNSINYEDPEASRHKVHFDNLTPLYPTERLRMEMPPSDEPTPAIKSRGEAAKREKLVSMPKKDISSRVIDLIAPDGSSYRLKGFSLLDGADNVIATYTVNLSSEAADGTWRLQVRDVLRGDSGYINTWSLNL